MRFPQLNPNDQFVLVDDRKENITGACQAHGWGGCLYTTPEKFVAALTGRACL